MLSDLIRGWIPLRVKKTRQNKNESFGSDSIRTEALVDPEIPGRYGSFRTYGSATMLAQQVMALQTELQRPKPL
jgi:hypothetical protein